MAKAAVEALLETPVDKIKKMKAGDELTFAAASPYVAMKITCCETSDWTEPTDHQLPQCEEVLTTFDAHTLSNCGTSTFASTGDNAKVDVRLDNEGVDRIGGKCFAKLRIQSNTKKDKWKQHFRSPTMAALLAETSTSWGREGPYFGNDRLKAALEASWTHGGTCIFEETDALSSLLKPAK